MTQIIQAIFQILIILFSITIHEVSHGTVAYYLGDDTAKRAGRLTLNPIKHLDPIGSFVVPLVLILTTGVGFGWAKPVPINPLNFEDQKYGQAKVSVAGPAANLSVAIIFGLALRFLSLGGSNFALGLQQTFSFIVLINIVLAVFNLVPIPPLDGSHILFTFLPERFSRAKIILKRYGFIFLMIFVFFLFDLILPIIKLLFRLIAGQSL